MPPFFVRVLFSYRALLSKSFYKIWSFFITGWREGDNSDNPFDGAPFSPLCGHTFYRLRRSFIKRSRFVSLEYVKRILPNYFWRNIPPNFFTFPFFSSFLSCFWALEPSHRASLFFLLCNFDKVDNSSSTWKKRESNGDFCNMAF